MEEKFKCSNCSYEYSISKSYCPACGVHKWYKKPYETRKGTVSAKVSNTGIINEDPPEISGPMSGPGAPKASQGLIEDLAEVDDVELILTDDVHVEDIDDKHKRTMRFIIIILLIILNLSALSSLIKKKRTARINTSYNQAVQYINNNELEKAGGIINEFDNNDEKLFLLGLLNFRAGQYARARDLLEQVAGNSRFSSYADAMLGYVYYQEGDYEKSHEFFRRAMLSLPNFPNLSSNYNTIRLYLVRD